MTARVFILNELCIKIEEICRNGFPYHAFLLESVAIEFLGKSSIKNCDWTDYKKNGYYFKKGIALLDNKYIKEQEKLYKKLRNGMAHFLGPNSGIALASIKNEGAEIVEQHLKYDKYGRLVIVFEVIHNDFKKAAMNLLQNVPQNDYSNKINNEFLSV